MYTDDYDEKQDDYDEIDNSEQDNNQFEEEKSKSPQKGGTGGILIIVILAIITIGLVYLILSKGKVAKKDDKYTIDLYPESIVIPLDGTQDISYDVRNNGEIVLNPNVKLIVDDENIASVDGTIIKGLNYGKTLLHVIFTDSSNTPVEETREIAVADGNPNIQLTDASLPDGDLYIPLNKPYNLALRLEPVNGYIEKKTFVSSDDNIVTVSKTGEVIGVSTGEAVISIDVNNGFYSKNLKVYVNNEYVMPEMLITPNNIKITNVKTTMDEGEAQIINYKVEPSNANTRDIEWSSTDNSIVSIDKNGKITALKEGVAIIKVTVGGNVSDTINIQVAKKVIPVTEISIATDTYSLLTGQSIILSPEVLPTDATDKTITYESSNSAVASVNANGEVVPLSAGTTTITIKASSGIEKQVTIMVIEDTTTVDPGGTGTIDDGGTTTRTCSDMHCTSGKYCSNASCIICPAGNYCSSNKKIACPAGKGSLRGSSSPQDCTYCATGYYSTGDGNGCVACPSGYTNKAKGLTSKDDCNKKVSSTSTPKATNKPTSTPKNTSSCDSCVNACMKNGGKSKLACKGSSACSQVC